MLEVLVLIVLVVGGWLVLQMVRQRRDAAPSTPPPPHAPLPAQVVREPSDVARGTRVLISHPLVRRAAERAAAQGNRYVARDGDNLYFVLDQIADEQERRRAHDILSRSLAEDTDKNTDLEVQDVIWVARLLGQG